MTPWRRVIPEKLTFPLQLKKFPALYGTRMFITAFTRARHLSQIDPVVAPHPSSLRSILILFPYLCLGFSNSVLPSGFYTETLYAPLFSPHVPHALPISVVSPCVLQLFLVIVRTADVGITLQMDINLSGCYLKVVARLSAIQEVFRILGTRNH
jgi:hypothetical protein